MAEVQHVLKRIMMQKKAACCKRIAKLEQVCHAALSGFQCKNTPIQVIRACGHKKTEARRLCCLGFRLRFL